MSNDSNVIKLNLVNPLNPNQIIKTENIIDNNQSNNVYGSNVPYQNNNANNGLYDQSQLNNIYQNNGLNNDLYNQNQPNDIYQSDILTEGLYEQPNTIITNNDTDNINEENKKKNLIPILSIALSAIIIIISWSIYFWPNSSKPGNVTGNQNNRLFTTYQFNIENYNTIFSTNLNNFSLMLTFDDSSYNLYVNDTFISTSIRNDSVKFHSIYDHLVYVNSGSDIRSSNIYIINNNTDIYKIYELDTISGMVPSDIEIKNNSIIVKGTRLSHNNSIIYNNSEMNSIIEDNTTWEQYGITENTVIQATYTYKFENGVFNSQPTISNQITIKDYLRNNM